MLKILVDPSFNGPTLAELVPLFDQMETIEATWKGTKPEIQAFNTIRTRNITLYVTNEKAVTLVMITLRVRCAIQQNMVEKSVQALIGNKTDGVKSSDWRGYVSRNSASHSQCLLLNRVANNIRKDPKKGDSLMRRVLVKSLTEGVNVLDADLLVGIITDGKGL